MRRLPSEPSRGGGGSVLHRLAAHAVVLLALIAGSAAAEPGYYVVTVYDNPGVKSVDLRYWSVKPSGYGAVIWPEVGLGWNVNGRWFTEVLASYVGPPGHGTRLDDLEWQNDVLLTQGQYPFDIALHTLWYAPQSSPQGDSLEFGPVLQTDVGRTQLNFNLFFERGFGNLSSQPTQLKYQWQVRHRWQPWLHVGAQGFGELGPWDHWAPHDAQSHRAGPALFGSVRAGPGAFQWQAAYLVGKTFATRANMFSMRVKYDFE